MPFRVRPGIRLMKGVRLNLGKQGPSLSLRNRGGSMTIGKKKVRSSVRIVPGVSYQTEHSWQGQQQGMPQRESGSDLLLTIVGVVVVVAILAALMGSS
jgi:Protein of unknown function (DUF4236)